MNTIAATNTSHKTFPPKRSFSDVPMEEIYKQAALDGFSATKMAGKDIIQGALVDTFTRDCKGQGGKELKALFDFVGVGDTKFSAQTLKKLADQQNPWYGLLTLKSPETILSEPLTEVTHLLADHAATRLNS